jgi:hypothetical protein
LTVSGIIWLASYPKSGNTWFRVFLSNLMGEPDKSADINDLKSTPIASGRAIFDDAVGCESSDLTAEEIDRLRPEVYRHISAQADEILFMKVHDAYTEVAPGRPLFPADATRGAIYFLRNPLDVAVSFAHHSGHDYDRAIAHMADRQNCFCDKPHRLHNQVRQKLLSWSSHVLSWMEAPGIKVCLLKYEDMKQRPLETFARAAHFAGLTYDQTQIQKAIELSSFDELRHQEERNGFNEKSPNTRFFFRRGEIGSWRQELNSSQIERIISDHGDVMRQYGYLDSNGKVLP